jgi:hypothetical protein
MALTVEDGTGLTTADAFVSLADFKAYCDARGRDYSSLSDTALEQAIVRATQYLSDAYVWQGWRVKERGHQDGTQALAWPRSGVVDRLGYSIAINSVPVEIVRATNEVAWYEANNVEALAPTYTPHEKVKSESVGEISITYESGSRSPAGARPVLLLVEDLIGQFRANRGGGLTMKSTR